MKAILIRDYGSVDVLSYEEIATPQPNADEVLIKVEAVGVNYADVMLRKGVYIIKPETPFVPGVEVVGTIEELGTNVKDFFVGQRVIAILQTGGYAEYAVAFSQQVFTIPENLEAGKALALVVQGWTALALLQDLKPNQTVLIQAAAGGVGVFLVQLALIRGAKVIGTASTSEKLQTIRKLGAEVAINYSESDWIEQILNATGKQGVDVLIESVGGEIGNQSLKCLAHGGTVIIYGQSSDKGFQLLSTDVFFKSLTVKGYLLRGETRENLGKYTKELMKLFDDGRLDIIVTKFPLSEAADAQRVLETRKTMGKVILQVS
ncbi:MAG: zinc-binding dehydrogenase [Calothrix sp. FI2-JRJ7]|jgi:NADPH2:quinone reductase|nr:zinc-binding dehydrogenase [Calothrix sp. FI2-JRJ7]